MLPFLRLGPLLIRLPGLVLLAGLWGATTLIEREARRLELDAGATVNMVLYGLLGGLVGARLVYAGQHLNAYLANPLALFSLDPGAMNGAAGVIVAVAVMVLFGRRRRLPLRPTLDALAPGLAVLLIAVGIANLLSGNAYGSAARLPWAIYLRGEYRHPTQIYETVAALVVFLIWRSTATRAWAAGSHFLLVVALSAAARIFIEAFRGDSVIWPGGFRAAQVAGLVVLGGAVYLMNLWGRGGVRT